VRKYPSMIGSRLLSKTPKLRNVVAHHELYLARFRRRNKGPIALVYGNCQAEALRRILVTHDEFAGRYHLLRVPAVQDLNPRELANIQRILPNVSLFITQSIRSDYRSMPIGTDQIIAGLPSSAQVLTYPVAYFTGLFPFHVYVNRPGDQLAASVPISEYHDLRILHAVGQGWGLDETLRWFSTVVVDPAWIRDNAERSLAELARRESRLTAKLAETIRSEGMTAGFTTINHPTNRLVTEVARQLLEHLGYADADGVLGSRQTYLDHFAAPREPQVLRALGTEPGPLDRNEWVTDRGTFSPAQAVAANFELYAGEPQLVTAGLAKHREQLTTLAAAFG